MDKDTALEQLKEGLQRLAQATKAAQEHFQNDEQGRRFAEELAAAITSAHYDAAQVQVFMWREDGIKAGYVNVGPE
jgi:hypothetical protein